MKTLFFLAGLTTLTFCSFAQNVKHPDLTEAQAQKILGQPAKLTEIQTDKKNKIDQFRCTYTAVKKDDKGRLGNLYYMAESYPSSQAAHDTLAYYISQNRGFSGWQSMSGVGNEGILHTDNKNFQLLIARKDSKMIRLKVNKITSYTPSINTMKEIAKELLN